MKTTTSMIVIEAPADSVWKALTQPELVKKWQYNTDLTTDWRLGGPIEFRNEWNGELFLQSGTVLDFEAPTSLRYSLFVSRPGVEDLPENRFTMSYRLDERNGSTMLTIVQEDPREPADVNEAGDESGNPVLQALKDLVEKG